MSKKNRSKRQKRKNKKSNRGTELRKQHYLSLADPEERGAFFRRTLRGMPSSLKEALVSRCGPPEKIAFLLLVDTARKLKAGEVHAWPMTIHDGVIVMMAPGAAEKVAVAALRLTRANQEVTKPAAPASPPSSLVN